MNNQQLSFLQRYCAITPERLQVLKDLIAGQKVNGATKAHFRHYEIIDDDNKLTADGNELILRARDIEEKRYGNFLRARDIGDLREIAPMRLARNSIFKSALLNTGHIKMLLCVAEFPGSMVGDYVHGYGWSTINYLINEDWISSMALVKKNGWYAPLVLSVKAAKLLGRVMADLKKTL